MSYSDFDLKKVIVEFNLEIVATADLFIEDYYIKNPK